MIESTGVEWVHDRLGRKKEDRQSETCKYGPAEADVGNAESRSGVVGYYRSIKSITAIGGVQNLMQFYCDASNFLRLKRSA